MLVLFFIDPVGLASFFFVIWLAAHQRADKEAVASILKTIHREQRQTAILRSALDGASPLADKEAATSGARTHAHAHARRCGQTPASVRPGTHA